MMYKLKTLKQIAKFAWKDNDGDFWISEKEYTSWHNEQTYGKELYYSVIEVNQYHQVVSNNLSSKYYIGDNVNDKNFKKIYHWVSKKEITKKDNPEYFI